MASQSVGGVGCRDAVAVNSCTAAMHLALAVAGVGEGDEVLTSPYTFAATGEVIRTFTLTVPNGQLGFDVVNLGDVTDDGVTDFLLTGFDRAYVVAGIEADDDGDSDSDSD